MLDIGIIEEEIKILENGETTFAVCDKLADLYIVKEHIKDLVPESNIDEEIDDIQSYFVKYMNDRSIANLDSMMKKVHQMLSELYLTCENDQERNIFKNHIMAMSSITDTLSI